MSNGTVNDKDNEETEGDKGRLLIPCLEGLNNNVACPVLVAITHKVHRGNEGLICVWLKVGIDRSSKALLNSTMRFASSFHLDRCLYSQVSKKGVRTLVSCEKRHVSL